MSTSPKAVRGILSKTRPCKNRYQVCSRDEDSYANHKADPDDLLVFGYSSKLFPPDDYSRKINKHLHLIPWNGDVSSNLMIDRYDCRGSLHDLSDFEDYSWNKNYQMSEEERKLEERLDQERYYDLINHDDLHQEEELKRLRASISNDANKYEEVKYSYDSANNGSDSATASTSQQYDPCEPTLDEDEDEKPFVAPQALQVPHDMEIPATEKMNSVIERTAKFISQQGLQMEIVLKTKQKDNTVLQFLQFEHYLNPYYKHMVARISAGKYNPDVQGTSSKEKQVAADDASDEEDSSSDEEGGYLHPSLFAPQQNNTMHDKMKAIKTVDPNHPLAKLIEKGRANQAMRKQEEEMKQQQLNSNNNAVPPPPPPPPPALSQNDVTMQEGEGSETTMTSSSMLNVVPPPPDVQQLVEQVAQEVVMSGGDSSSLESSLLASDSGKYSFIQSWHESHPYYEYRKKVWYHAIYPPPPPATPVKDDEHSEEANEEENVEKQSGPINFSIKPMRNAKSKVVMTELMSEAQLEDEEEEELDGEEAKAEQKEEEEEIEPELKPPPPPPYSLLFKANNSNHQNGNGVANNDDDRREETYERMKKTKKEDEELTKAKMELLKHYESSTFVNSNGEVESIEMIRQKQAVRRQRAKHMFMSKKSQDAAESKEVNQDDEDIFDLKNETKPKQFDTDEDIFPEVATPQPPTLPPPSLATVPPATIATVLPTTVATPGATSSNAESPVVDSHKMQVLLSLHNKQLEKKEEDKKQRKRHHSTSSSDSSSSHSEHKRKSKKKTAANGERKTSSSSSRASRKDKKSRKSSKHSKSHKQKKQRHFREEKRSRRSSSSDSDGRDRKQNEGRSSKRSKEQPKSTVYSDLSEGEVRSD